MTIQRIKQYPMPPQEFKDFKTVREYLSRLYGSLSSESTERVVDFDILRLNNVPWIDVRSCGAGGGGVHNDTAAIQAALNSVPSGGGIVFLPSSSYRTSHISLTVAGTTLWGNGFGNTSLLSTHLYADGPTPPIIWIKASDCIVRGIKVGYVTPPDYAVGYVAANPVTECHPIAIGWPNTTPVNNTLVKYCYIDGSLCHGIAIGYGNHSIVKDNIIMNVTATGISGEMCSRALITGNKVYNSRDNGIYIESRAATITTYEEYGWDNIISENIVINSQQGGIGTDTTINTIISKNIIRNSWATPILVGTNHPSAGLSWNAIRPIVSDNIINDAFGNYGSGQYHTQDIVTVGGGVWGCITAELQNVDGLGDAVISENICDIGAPGGSYNGIYGKSAHGIAVTGNVIRGDAAKSGYGTEIGLNSGSKVTNFVVTGNTLKHFSVGLMALYANLGSIKSNIVEDAVYGLYIAHCDSIDADNNDLWSVTYESFLSDNTNLLGSLGNKISYKNAIPTTGTWIVGDICWHSDAAASEPLGWYCITSGTFSAATDNTGDTDGSTAVITGMTDTSDFFVGEYATVSAGFPTTGPYRILAKTATTITLDTASDSAQSNITVSTPDPVFKAMANLAA